MTLRASSFLFLLSLMPLVSGSWFLGSRFPLLPRVFHVGKCEMRHNSGAACLYELPETEINHDTFGDTRLPGFIARQLHQLQYTSFCWLESHHDGEEEQASGEKKFAGGRERT